MSNKKYIYSFETLDVWKKSINFAKLIYKVTENFPSTEKFGLVSQIRRVVVSISSNLAEGSAKQSLKDQARFTEISIGSLLEILNQIILSFELEFITSEQYLDVRQNIDDLYRQINALKVSQLKRYNKL